MRSHMLLLAAVSTTLLGCSRTSERESRFLRDRQAVVETVRSCFQRPYEGLVRSMPQEVPSNLDFPGEDHIRRSLRSSGVWFGDDQWVVIYRPATEASNPTDVSIDPARLLDFYFRGLEASGFTSGVSGVPLTSLNSMQVASKSWANKDRTLLVTGYAVSDKQSGETIITTIVRETLNR
jgi:hypothetical protein